ETLDKYGVAVVEVLGQKECESLRDQAWKEFEDLTLGNIKKDDPNSWKNIYDLFPSHSMLIQHFQVGQMQWVWDCRQHPQVKRVFEILHQEKDLLVSFDGISFHQPPEITKRGWFKGNYWFHSDQSPESKEYSIQGLINLYPVNQGDASLAVYEGSHK